MSFDQDPNETAQISGSDFAQMCDEMKQLRAERDALKQSSEFHDKLGITLLDAKYLDPACHKGCQSIKHRNDLAATQQTVARLRAVKEGMMEAEMALSQAEGLGADEVEAAPHWKAARKALATPAQ